MTNLEQEIENKLRRMVTIHGGLCLKWVCPGWTGVPDRLVLLPGGILMFVELKRPKGFKISSMQKWWKRKLSGLGFDFCFVYCEQDIKDLEQVIIDRLNGR